MWCVELLLIFNQTCLVGCQVYAFAATTRLQCSAVPDLEHRRNSPTPRAYCIHSKVYRDRGRNRRKEEVGADP
ncbi:hypothetical protein C8F01DRAFT_1098746 [Mycena amicta]|nr:hypothetical protein C8F01DRAFT_1098746 [Mycena amicta]